MHTFTLLTCLGLVHQGLAGYYLQDDYSGDNFFKKMSFFTVCSAWPLYGPPTLTSVIGKRSYQRICQLRQLQHRQIRGPDCHSWGSGLHRRRKQEDCFRERPQQCPCHKQRSVQSRPCCSRSQSHAGRYLRHVARFVSLTEHTVSPGFADFKPHSWMVGPNWPNEGEIDIIEGVHDQSQNDMTLHTSAGCTISNNGHFSGGSVTTSNCDVAAQGNAGCQIAASNSATYGTQFNNNGGGVCATEWTSNHINIWFWQQGSQPGDVLGASPNPAGWGRPLASFTPSCNLDSYFQNQQIVSQSLILISS